MKKFPPVYLLILVSVLGFTFSSLSACSPAQQSAAPTAQSLRQHPQAATTPPATVSEGDSNETAVVKAVRANLRDHPNTSGGVLREIRQGDVLMLVSRGPIGAWYRVRHKKSGAEGWVHGNGIVITNAPSGVVARAPQQPERATNRASNTSQNVSTGGSPSGRGYRNVDGDFVPSPVFSKTAPEGATAKCRDGSYSFSRHRRGTCSHHGGVAQWL